jgi:hypothetical protein
VFTVKIIPIYTWRVAHLYSELAVSREPFGIGYMYIYNFLHRMTDNMTSQNINISSWVILYTYDIYSYMYVGLCINTENNLLTYLLTHGAESFWRSRQFCSYSRISQHLRNPKVHYRVHKSPPLVSTLSQIHPIHTIPSYLSTQKKTDINVHLNLYTFSLLYFTLYLLTHTCNVTDLTNALLGNSSVNNQLRHCVRPSCLLNEI